MGFNFDKKPTVEICGKEYECDITSLSLIDGVANDFPKILLIGEELTNMQNELSVAVKKCDAQGILDITKKATEKNKELIEACRAFIFGCLGEQEYMEIFSGRKVDSADHVNLCNYIFNFIMQGREEIVNQYLAQMEQENVAY